ncbi:MAG: hypothetical protein SFZ23_05090 [Planctomycetota bacterium]|nr:hypothetical protein [Planctomycetota bacterium]
MKIRCLASLTAAAVAHAAFAQVSFTPIGLLPGTETAPDTYSDAYGVSNSGVAVGTFFDPRGDGAFIGFRWTAGGGAVDIGTLGVGRQVFPRSITSDGLTIVGEITGPGVAFRKVGNAPIEDLGFPGGDVYDASAASDVSEDGSVVAGVLSRVEDGTFRAARWSTTQGWQDLGVLGFDVESSAQGISGDGSVVVGNSVGNFFTAFKWTASQGMTALENPFGIESNTAAIALSLDATVITGQAQNVEGITQAPVWFADGSVGLLDNLPGFDAASGFGVSGDGSVVVGTVFIENVGEDRAVFWTTRNRRVYDLKQFLADNGIATPGWRFLALKEVSQDGRSFVGWGFNPTNQLEAYLVRVDTLPCPADFNSDGQVDFFDFLDFAAAFASDDPAADFDQSGQVDFFDYLDFAEEFDLGCD